MNVTISEAEGILAEYSQASANLATRVATLYDVGMIESPIIAEAVERFNRAAAEVSRAIEWRD